MNRKISFAISNISYAILLSLISDSVYATDFNIDVLDIEERKLIDLSKFSRAGYIMPGQYQMDIFVNKQRISPFASALSFIESDNNETDSLSKICLTSDIVEKMGFKPASLKKITYWNNGLCADFSSLPGVDIQSNLAEEIVNINIPQAWLEYSDAYWLPPSRWDDGLSGLLFDYNINAIVNMPYKQEQSQAISYNGTTGGNLGAWRLRADYQGNLNHTNGSTQGLTDQFSWSRIYAYRGLPSWQANLTLGENYINSDIFSSWLYTGVSLESDERMFPPRMRGYAPQISGIADTNARVVISQQGRVLYDATVPAGPFTIQDLDSSIRGRLDVEVIEQNGQKKTFQVDTAYVPYLTRPGKIRYKLISGRSRNYEHTTEGPIFAAGEASWGISNSWSAYGGSILANNYNAFALGVGVDLNSFGALSADVTQSIARIPEQNIQMGKSWRVNYSRRFDEANTDISFAGYRFSEREYMTMEQYLDARYRNNFKMREKELYTISLNKNVEEWSTAINLQYSHQTYWDQRKSDYYTLSMNRYFDAFGFKSVSLGLSASRSKYQNYDNDSAFLRLSVPLETGTVSYNGSMSDGRYTNTLGYSDTLNYGLSSYSLNAGVSSGDSQYSQSQMSAYFSHSSPIASLSINASVVQDNYTSFGVSASGGVTVTAKGDALHAGGMNGGTRLLVDTDDVGGVPINDGKVTTNRWGIGVVTDVSSYYRNTTTVDLNQLPDDMDAKKSVVESVLTEGAIGYRKFEVLKGLSLFAVIKLSDNSIPPFGASVLNKKGRELGMVVDEGIAWLSGITPGEILDIRWNGEIQCSVDIPNVLESEQKLLLLCNNKVTQNN